LLVFGGSGGDGWGGGVLSAPPPFLLPSFLLFPRGNFYHRFQTCQHQSLVSAWDKVCGAATFLFHSFHGEWEKGPPNPLDSFFFTTPEIVVRASLSLTLSLSIFRKKSTKKKKKRKQPTKTKPAQKKIKSKEQFIP